MKQGSFSARLAAFFFMSLFANAGEKVTFGQRRHYAVSGVYKNRNAFYHDFRREHLRRIKFSRAHRG